MKIRVCYPLFLSIRSLLYRLRTIVYASRVKATQTTLEIKKMMKRERKGKSSKQRATGATRCHVPRHSSIERTAKCNYSVYTPSKVNLVSARFFIRDQTGERDNVWYYVHALVVPQAEIQLYYNPLSNSTAVLASTRMKSSF